ncbi:aspartate aminotransferase family protein [Nodularia harveyana UHCC-0300]|uniref:Aspartate aminotransferase family protein n=1 Tax=Nodularia harveyana UHCC-0300 TaxID=2974287 RepID=A0ABU5UL35_9CYAN|nr:aspartate aminotransferase family protein [Nodularia harveyana]MEA5583641.1 aspartate aminotransferase family protein [Nodularia harveyana UHCC-0300]
MVKIVSRKGAKAQRREFFVESESLVGFREAIAEAQEVLINCFATRTQPYSGKSPQELTAAIAEVSVCPEHGLSLSQVLAEVGESIIQHSVVVTHPTCMAHLHCPPLLPALAAEVLISGTNQSLDSWDQSPAATVLEQHLVNWLCQNFGYDADGDGIFTSGGTQSNFMGLLLARDAYARHQLNWSVQTQGLPPAANRFRILCSQAAHFTISQAVSLLGLGQQSVVMVETDSDYRLCSEAVERKLAELHEQDLLPIALVATVGTTDFGSIDPLPELAACAEKYGLWLHVDAAFGGGLIMSDRHQDKLNGIALADSITVDFHKLFYQPISCGAFLLKQRQNFDLIKLHADYLNPEINETASIPDLVTKSIQTTRRFDALKLFLSLRTLGRKQFADMIDTTIELAQETASLINAEPTLELANNPTINAVVFRYLPSHTPAHLDSTTWANQINSHIRLSLLQQGIAVIAQTKIGQLTYLKFTLLNPRTAIADVQEVLNEITTIGEKSLFHAEAHTSTSLSNQRRKEE